MPLSKDDPNLDYDGSWGDASAGWPFLRFATVEDATQAYVIAHRDVKVPYGSYVLVGGDLRLENEEHAEKVCIHLAVVKFKSDWTLWRPTPFTNSRKESTDGGGEFEAAAQKFRDRFDTVLGAQLEEAEERQAKRNCHACAHSYMEPDSPYLICGHPDAGEMGTFVKSEPLEHCPDFSKFKQHPRRHADGSLRSGSLSRFIRREGK